jgi:hypothetical protein
MEVSNGKLFACMCVCVYVSEKKTEKLLGVHLIILYVKLRCYDCEKLKDIKVDARKTQSKSKQLS